jgi:hypothetical protein
MTDAVHIYVVRGSGGRYPLCPGHAALFGYPDRPWPRDRWEDAAPGTPCSECSYGAPEDAFAPCRRCGDPSDRASHVHHGGPEGDLVRSGLCWKCAFWTNVLLRRSPETSFVHRGVHYTVHPDHPPGTPDHCHGHGGRLFRITFPDGRVVESRNVWCQGGVPESFRAELEDDARVEFP